MAKMGRPTVDNPINRKVSVKFSQEEYSTLSNFAKTHNLSVAQVIRKSVELYVRNTKG